MKTIYYWGIGSRETPPDVCELMTQIARELSEEGLVLRPGGADGADLAFEAEAGNMAQIFLPWYGFNDRKDHSLCDWEITQEALAIAEMFHPAWDKLGIPARTLMARNAYQIAGRQLDEPVTSLCRVQGGEACRIR